MLAVMKKEGKPGVSVSEAPVPEIGPTDLLIKVKAASICGTDAQIYRWTDWAKGRIHPPLIFGHEACGEVVKTGKLVRDFSIGDIVSGESHIPCLHCYQCHNDQMHLCQNLKILGVDTQGCFAEYVLLPEICAWKNPAGMPPEIGTILEPLGNAVYLTLAEDVTGKSVAVFGCGPSGLFSVGVAAASGASPVISVIKHEFRRKIAEEMGANYFFRSCENNPAEEILKLTKGQGVDVVLETTGNPRAIQEAFHSVKKGGRISLFGIPSAPISLDLAKEVIFKGIRIYGINGREMYRTWHKMQNLLAAGKLNPKPVITHQFALSEFVQGMETMIAPDRKCGKIVLFPSN